MSRFANRHLLSYVKLAVNVHYHSFANAWVVIGMESDG